MIVNSVHYILFSPPQKLIFDLNFMSNFNPIFESITYRFYVKRNWKIGSKSKGGGFLLQGCTNESALVDG